MSKELSGHRRRLRQRFLKDCGHAMADYELLEMLLYVALPRGDTKPLAKALLTEFGSFARVLNASPNELVRVSGVGEAVVMALKLPHAVVTRLLREAVLGQHIIDSWEDLLNYCKVAMGHLQQEQLRLLLLNAKNRVIGDEVMNHGTIDQTILYPREVIKRVLETGATGIIIVHNHPSGDTQPSKADIAITQVLYQACKLLDISLHDHLVVSAGSHFSFRAQGLLG